MSIAPWVTADEVAACCVGIDAGSNAEVFDEPAQAATDVLYKLSGGLFPGPVETVVRPHQGVCGWWSRWTPPVWFDGWGWWVGRRRYGVCTNLSLVTLAGIPVREVTEVKIDGVVIDPSEYRLDYNRDLVRLRDPAEPNTIRRWPCCQILDLPDTEPGTWSIAYTWGADPPQDAKNAAVELACEIAKACASDDECQLPSNVTKVTRAGITIDRNLLAVALAAGVLGLPMSDLFLSTYNPNKIERRSALWSPDVPQYPYRPGA